MRKLLLLPFFVGACATPKYSYNFSHYREGNHSVTANLEASDAVGQAVLTASVQAEPIISPVESPKENVAPEVNPASARPARLTHDQKKQLKEELHKEIKDYKAAVKSGDIKKVSKEDAIKAMDQDLKMAAIFGAVGLVALIISGPVFYVIGGISLLIGVIFFVVWLSHQ